MSDTTTSTTVPTTETTTTLPTLVSTLNMLNTNYNDLSDEERTEFIERSRVLAVNEALNDLLTSSDAQAAFLVGTQKSATAGRSTFRLTQWTMMDSRSYHGHYLLNLLKKGDLLTRMQAWLDDTCGEGLRVYYHPLKRTNNSPITFALTVSWDASRFHEVDDILERNRQTGQDRSHDTRTHDNRSDRGHTRTNYRNDTRSNTNTNFSRRPRNDERDNFSGDRRNDRSDTQRRTNYRRNDRDERPMRNQFGRTQDFGHHRRNGDDQ